MSTERLHRLDDEGLGAALAGLDLRWSDAPASLTQDVLDSIALTERRVAPGLSGSRRRRLVIAIVAALLALTATAFAARFVLDLRGVIVEQVPGPPIHLPSSPLAGPELGTPLPLDEAAAAAGVDPAVPELLGAPDRVWLVRPSAVVPEGDGALLALAWEPGPGLPPIPGSRWGAVLFRFTGSADLAKKMLDVESAEVRETMVGSFPAYWITGPHELTLATAGGAVRVRVTGSVLLWDDLETGWRLETSLPQAEAIRIAESVPLPGP
ncbi:MAG TPA: hypothetical protein VIB62_07460 [Actinomycetota bacterium]